MTQDEGTVDAHGGVACDTGLQLCPHPGVGNSLSRRHSTPLYPVSTPSYKAVCSAGRDRGPGALPWDADFPGGQGGHGPSPFLRMLCLPVPKLPGGSDHRRRFPGAMGCRGPGRRLQDEGSLPPPESGPGPLTGAVGQRGPGARSSVTLAHGTRQASRDV